MDLTTITITRSSFIAFGVFSVLTIGNAILLYVTKKKAKQNVLDSKEYKKEMAKFEKVMTTKSKGKDKDGHVSFKILNNKSKLSWDFWRTWYLDKYHPGKTIFVNMELLNGFHKSFIVKEKDEGFLFRGKKYMFDDDCKYFNLDTRLWTFDYHEGLTLPFKRKVPVTKIKKTIESTDGIDIEYAINPSTLQRFMTAKIAEGVMKGTQLDEFLRKLQMFLIVTMVACLVHLALFLYASGILQNLKVPGVIG